MAAGAGRCAGSRRRCSRSRICLQPRLHLARKGLLEPRDAAGGGVEIGAQSVAVGQRQPTGLVLVVVAQPQGLFPPVGGHLFQVPGLEVFLAAGGAPLAPLRVRHLLHQVGTPGGWGVPLLVAARNQVGQIGRVLAQGEQRLFFFLGVQAVLEVRRTATLLAFGGHGAARPAAVAPPRRPALLRQSVGIDQGHGFLRQNVLAHRPAGCVFPPGNGGAAVIPSNLRRQNRGGNGQFPTGRNLGKKYFRGMPVRTKNRTQGPLAS